MANEERKKILVVDDDRLSLIVAEDFLKDDYDVDCVDSGEAALLYLQSNYPDVILLDLVDSFVLLNISFNAIAISLGNFPYISI